LKKHENIAQRVPPKQSKNLFTDIINFLVHRPEKDTLITFKSIEERDDYNQRIMQRIGINSDKYSVLNIHRIGIEAPVSHVFNELLNWNGDSSCWPNHIARVDRIDDSIEKIRILPFGWKKYPFSFMKSILGLHVIPLFLLNLRRMKETPDNFDFDNARYLLYDCTGGYPIGIYTMYVHSSIPELGEKCHTQLVLVVGFNFYGKDDWQKNKKLINNIWEGIHNRVTANVLTRIKQLSEWRFDKLQNH